MEEETGREGNGPPDVSSPRPESEHPPPPELRGEQPRVNAMTGGRGEAPPDQHDGHVGAGESRWPELRYQKGPDAESGKATPRESGKV